jgi:hypothetical protein
VTRTAKRLDILKVYELVPISLVIDNMVSVCLMLNIIARRMVLHCLDDTLTLTLLAKEAVPIQYDDSNAC